MQTSHVFDDAPAATPPARWHHDSQFGPGPRRELSWRDRAMAKYRLRQLARSGRISAKQEWVGVALLYMVGADGQCDPSQATLAELTGCCVRTVGRSLVRLRQFGEIRWTRRLVRVGWRTEQTSNAYVFCGGQNAQETPTELNLLEKKVQRPAKAVVWQGPAPSPELEAGRRAIDAAFRKLPWLAEAYRSR